MGVPKFYRWISERYPCLSEVVKEFQIPEFDNLYLDMNGIIHVCSHPEDDNPHFRITEEKIFSDIMYYIEFLFRMIKPRKVFFMAVDGVAPRAKMNQQRGRRFRSASAAEELERRARAKGEVLPTDKRFDSNCITPGTPFMVRLQEQLKYFVVKKVSTDPLWHGVRVYLSGHETPGEGEHKIMDFIRAERASANYDPNTRHCLYGLDADLMMLGLATHEPHFSLLREEVRFGGKRDKHSKRPQTPEETTFHLLHLSLFREYLDFEFSELKEKLETFQYDLESVIDDWVLMGFLVGNDFIPHLPNLHINHDALPLLWRTYIEVLPSCGGYINDGGHLNLERFEKYLAALSQFDFDTFSEQVGDLKWLESKKAEASADKAELLGAARKLAKNQKRTVNSINKHMQNQFALLESLSEDEVNREELGTELIDFPLDEPSTEDISDLSDEDTLGDEFRHHKRDYYMTKLEYEKVTPEVLRDQAEGYVRGIQWILLYYYEGVPSWSWFYPHHYAPYMSDVKEFKDMDIQFDLCTPFMPFEQLMAVLPAASKDLLPKPYQNLMVNDSSPVIDFYPPEFETDLNGKQQEWEAVVLIPFIDENRLLSAIRSVQHQLTAEEKSRNRHGPHLLYEYSSEPGDVYRSPLPNHFPDIAVSHFRLTTIHMDEFRILPQMLRKGILPGAKLDVFFPGFPTLKHIPHRAELSKEGVKVFQMNSRGYNTMLYIEQDENVPDIERVAREYLGKEIYVGWPHLFEAKVVTVCNDEFSFSFGETASGKGKSGNHPQVKRDKCDQNMASIWHKEASTIAERYRDRRGIVVGETHILLRALPMTGRRYIFSSHGRVTMDKQFGNMPVPFALQATVKDIAVHDPGFCQFKTLTEYFQAGAPVFMLGWPHYGCQGEVIETDMENGRVRINIVILEEPQLAGIINNQQQDAERYFSGYLVAQWTGISSHLLSRLTGTIYIFAGNAELAREQAHPHRVNVGLNLKFTKRGEEVPGYTKNLDGQWQYSQKTVDILKQYMARFPEMFDVISRSSAQRGDQFYESEVIPSGCKYTLKDVEEYIKGLPCAGLKPMKTGADIISEGTIVNLQSETDRVVEINKKRQKRVKMQVKPHLLYKPMVTSGSLIPDPTATYQLFDRVVNTRQGFPVPFGLRGTVVGIHPAEVEVNTMYEVVFDEEFQGGIEIRNSSKRGYRMPPSGLLNLTHGVRKYASKPANLAQAASQADTRNYFGQENRTVSGASGPQAVGYTPGYPSQSKNQNYYGYQDNKTGYHDYQYSGGGNKQLNSREPNHQFDRQSRNSYPDNSHKNFRESQDSGGDVSGMIFNGGTGYAKFVTPKVQSGHTAGRQMSLNGAQQGALFSPQRGSSEFDNIWKQLQTALPPGSPSSTQGHSVSHTQVPSLSQAAAALPRVPSPEQDAHKEDKISSNTTKIDVQTLFKGASGEEKDVAEQSKIVRGNKPQSGSSRVVSNNEFAAMFRSLEEQEMLKEKSEATVEESSDALKKMLNIAEQSEESGQKSSAEGGARSYGRQLSVQELFDGAKKQQSQSDIPKQQEPKKGKGQPKQRGGGHQSPRQPQGQQQGYHGNKRPTQLMTPAKGGNRNPVMELMTFCKSLQMGLPMYDYIQKGGFHYCVVTLYNGARFQGSTCKTREEAAESAASVALFQLQGTMQMAAHPMLQMAGYLPQGRPFSSANSAFSPVNAFQGFYQGNRGQGRGFHGYQQQRPHTGGHSHLQNRGGHSRQPTGPEISAYSHPEERVQHTDVQTGSSQAKQEPCSTDSYNRERPMPISVPSQRQLGKETKSQPTAVVSPFVPMQVTRKQTPQKPRKDSVSDENTLKAEVEASAKDSNSNQTLEGDNSMLSDRVICDKADKVSGTSVTEESVNQRRNDQIQTPENKNQTKQPSTPESAERKQGSSSTKKPRRRLAANFNL